MRRLYLIVFLFIPLLLSSCGGGEVKKSAENVFSKDRAPYYWGKPGEYYEAQGDVMFSVIEDMLEEYPPQVGAPLGRVAALSSLDMLCHDTRYDDSPPFHSFLDGRIDHLIASLDRPSRKGLTIYKVFNDAFIVRTRKATVAFDLCGKYWKLQAVDSLRLSSLISHCDALFISHRDSDHADLESVMMFLSQGSPVYCPEDCFPSNGKVTHLRREAVETLPLPIRGGRNLDVTLIPGHQDNLQNNVYVVEFPEGYTVAHFGDQWEGKEARPVVENAASLLGKPLDVMIADNWLMPLEETVRSFSPRLFVTGHENEMSHSVDHREAFWLSFQKLENMDLPCPYLVMGWGEEFNFRK